MNASSECLCGRQAAGPRVYVAFQTVSKAELADAGRAFATHLHDIGVKRAGRSPYSDPEQ
jgi:hypothetical protein